MKTSKNKHDFLVSELLRFYDSQRVHGESYLKATLRLWKEQPGKAYKEVVDKLEGV